VVHTFHGHVLRGYFSPAKTRLFQGIEKILAKFTDAIVVVSESQKRELCSKYHIAPAHKFRVIPLGFDLEPFLTCKGETYQKSEVRSQKSEVSGQKSVVRSQRTEVRSRKSEVGSQWSEVSGQKSEDRSQKSEDNLGMASHEWKIGIVGRLVPIKNHMMFLRSAKIFLDHNPDIPAKFLIVGDGELRDDLMAYCEQQGLSDYVKFCHLCGW